MRWVFSMTSDKQFKAEVRRFAADNGLSFADARRRVLAAKEAEQEALNASRDVPDLAAAMAGMAANSSVDAILSRQRETMALINRTVVQDPAFAVALRAAKEMAQFQVGSSAKVMAESALQERLRQQQEWMKPFTQSAAAAAVTALNSSVTQNPAITAAVQAAKETAQFQANSAAKAAASAVQEHVRMQQEWMKPFTQSAAAAAVPTGFLAQVSKQHGEIVDAARRSVTGPAVEAAKRAFLDGIRIQEETAAMMVRTFADSIGAKAAQGVLDSVASLQKDAVASMASVWKLGQPSVDQLQRQVLFQRPTAEAAAPAWSLPAGTSIRPLPVNRDAEISALKDVQQRQERIEKLLQQLLDKDKDKE